MERNVDIGKPNKFDVSKYLECVEAMVLADEIAYALTMLDNVPGFYRDNPTPEMLLMRRKIHEATFSIVDYTNDKDELNQDGVEGRIDTPFCQPRGTLIEQTVRAYNNNGVYPHIVELGPFDYWLPHGLKNKGLGFTYNPIAMTQPTDKTKNEILYLEYGAPYNLEIRPTIFVCFEVIEHMWRPEDIVHLMQQKLKNIEPEIIMISTPKYTMGGGLETMEGNKFGHLRTYTPKELLAFCVDNFKSIDSKYNWLLVDSPMLVCVGSKKPHIKYEV